MPITLFRIGLILTIAVSFVLAPPLVDVDTAQAQEEDHFTAEYSDVPRGHWAYEAVAKISKMGLIEGLPDDTYAGHKIMTRYAGTTALARLTTRSQLSPLASPPPPILYPDVPAGHWASDALNRLDRMGIVEGLPDGTFAGNQPLTRYAYAMILGRLMFAELVNDQQQEDAQAGDATSFPDVSRAHWAWGSVHRLSNAGIFEGFTDGKFQGHQPMTRYAFAVSLARLVG